MQTTKAPSHLIVQHAREATQTAEDARTIADRRRQEERLAAAEQAAIRAQTDAANQLRQSRIEADAARSQAEVEKQARERAEAEAADLRNRADRVEPAQSQMVTPPPPPPSPAQQPAVQKSEARMRLFEQLNGALLTRDTPRGLVVTLSDSAFDGAAPRGAAINQLSRLAAIVSQHPELHLDVEGFSDEAATAATSFRRAEAVQRILLAQGVSAGRMTARGMGDSRLLTSNSSPMGRVQNRRVEIIISGDSIGTVPFWDRTYSLAPSGK